MVGFWDWFEALALLEREVEWTERGVSMVGNAIVGAAGAETVERASLMISSSSNPTMCGLDTAVLTKICPHW